MDLFSVALGPLQTTCLSTHETQRAVVAPPSLINAWVERLDFQRSELPVISEPCMVGNEDQVAGFCEHRFCGKRILPVVALVNKPDTSYFGVG